MLQTRLAPAIVHANIAHELAEATQAASVAAGPYVGQGLKNEADGAAVEAMYGALSNGSLSFEVVLGEGEKDGAPMLPEGLVFGVGRPEHDAAVDPIEGTTRAAEGRLGSMSVMALTPYGAIPRPNGIFYMNRLVVGPEAAQRVKDGDIRVDGDPTRNLQLTAHALGKPVTELSVAVLNRARNGHIIQAAQQLGARIVLLDSGDLAPAMQACSEPGERRIDLSYGSGGAPEAILAGIYAAIRGGHAQAMWDPQTPAQRRTAFELGEMGRVIDLNTLWGNGPLYFAATGITDSETFGPGQQPMLLGSREVDGEWYAGTSIKTWRTDQPNGNRPR